MRKLSAVIVIMFFLSVQNVLGAETSSLTELQKRMDILWVVIAAILVFLMQAGFMCLESGMARAKNSINVATKNLADFLIATIGFWFMGFGIMFGTSFFGLFGTSQFFIDIENNQWQAAFFIFQAVFAGTAATIDSGAVAERTKFSGYILMSFIISVLIYPVFGHWAWGSFLNGETKGWLEQLGFLDFAGSTVVHSVGAWVALAGIIVIGPRIGRFDDNGKPVKIHPHSLRLVFLGTFLLFFGWFGFNAGSTLKATGAIAGIILNTTLSACFAGVTATLMSWMFSPDNVPEADMLANGVIGGLVGITAGCAYVGTKGAMAIGIGSGLLVYWGIRFMEEKLKLDDVVGAIPVHGFAGAWGTIGAAVFMTSSALEATGNSRLVQTGIQAIGVVTAFIWAFGTAWLILRLFKYLDILRVSPEDESVGLNVSQHGAHSSILELTYSMKTIIESPQYDESLKVWAEHGTEAGDLAHYFNKLVDTLSDRHMKEKNHINDSFGRYVTPRVRDEILSGRLAELGGERRDATVLFCDIRNFTSLAEKMAPSKVVEFLNTFFNEMVLPIEQNEGILDKYIGDCIMAVFGPPYSYEDHALRAVDAAMAMIQKVELFNEEFSEIQGSPLKVGIGINSGEVIAGNIGSSNRMDYTVIGDTVNIAARIEKITKKIGFPILYSQYTQMSMSGSDQIQHQSVGSVRVRGRKKSFELFRPVMEGIV